MKRNKKDLNRPEDHLVYARIESSGDCLAEKIACKVFLPDRIEEKPYLILKPSNIDEYSRLAHSFRAQFSAKVTNQDDTTVFTSFSAPEIYVLDSPRKYWGSDLVDINILAEPENLHVIDHINSDQEKTEISFWVTPNQFLTPFIVPEYSPTGDIKIERYSKLKFELENNLILSFEKKFKYKTLENGDILQFSYLTAEATVDVLATDHTSIKNNLLSTIDDFLLLSSFASRKRTSCLGWSAFDRNAHTKFYRGNYVFPTNIINPRNDDPLIDARSFDDFMRKSYSGFLEYENKNLLRSALNSLVPHENQIIQHVFLSRFAGLESLVLDHKRLNNKELILSKEEWKALKSQLENLIRNSENPKLDKEQRCSMYKKLEELNRVSLKESYDLFLKENSIRTEDLWPVFKSSNLVGLADIRNRIIHGDPFPSHLLPSLIIANEHLSTTLERIILKILGYDYAIGNLSYTQVQTQDVFIEELPIHREKISNFINNQ